MNEPYVRGYVDFALAEEIKRTGRKVVLCTDNDETLGDCRTYHDIGHWKLAEMVLFRETMYDDVDEFIDAYVEHFWDQNSKLSESEQIEVLKLAAESKWNFYKEEIILVYTNWWSPREA